MKRVIIFVVLYILCISIAHATDDPAMITLDSIALINGTENRSGMIIGITVPKAYVPNFGMGRFFFTRKSNLSLSSDEEIIKLKFDADVDSTFVDVFWLLPTDFYWALGFGSGLVKVTFDDVVAQSSLAELRMTYFESEISKKEKLIQGRHIFSRISFLSMGNFSFHLGVHHLDYDEIEIITDKLSDDLPSLNANMITVGVGFSM